MAYSTRRLSAETAMLYLRHGRLRNLVNGAELKRAGFRS